MIRIIYWGLVALDILGLLLLFVLGLAAAGSAGTSPTRVALYLLLIPGLVLALSIAVFTRSGSPVLRAIAFMLAAAPLLIASATHLLARAQFAAHSSAGGDLTFFRAGPMREMVEAIRRNDAATVSALAPQVDVNAAGMSGMTLLIVALRQLRITPERHEVLAALLTAGADPNQAIEFEHPLEMAAQVAAAAGVAPVRMLLDAGANPNLGNSMGTPLFFAGIGKESGRDVLALFLDRGAQVNAKDPRGETALIRAATAPNWDAALLLLEHGADWRTGRSFNGLSFTELVEKHVRERVSRAAFDTTAAVDDGAAAVIDFLQREGGDR